MKRKRWLLLLAGTILASILYFETGALAALMPCEEDWVYCRAGCDGLHGNQLYACISGCDLVEMLCDLMLESSGGGPEYNPCDGGCPRTECNEECFIMDFQGWCDTMDPENIYCADEMKTACLQACEGDSWVY